MGYLPNKWKYLPFLEYGNFLKLPFGKNGNFRTKNGNFSRFVILSKLPKLHMVILGNYKMYFLVSFSKKW